jgi:hypothetical protein
MEKAVLFSNIIIWENTQGIVPFGGRLGNIYNMINPSFLTLSDASFAFPKKKKHLTINYK